MKNSNCIMPYHYHTNQKGAMTVLQIVGTGVVSLGVFFAGLLFTKAQATDATVSTLSQRTATVEQAIKDISSNIDEIKIDNKDVAKNITQILIKINAQR